MKAAIFCLLLLTGCASMEGVKADPEELEACKQHGCSVWTEYELMELIRQIYKKGYDAGVKSI